MAGSEASRPIPVLVFRALFPPATSPLAVPAMIAVLVLTRLALFGERNFDGEARGLSTCLLEGVLARIGVLVFSFTDRDVHVSPCGSSNSPKKRFAPRFIEGDAGEGETILAVTWKGDDSIGGPLGVSGISLWCGVCMPIISGFARGEPGNSFPSACAEQMGND